MKIISKKNRGYTLVEVLVSVFIIVLLSGIFIANYRGSANSSRLNLAVQQTVSDIRLAQNNSLGLAEYGGSLPQGGWGVRFVKNSGQYYVFADKDEGKDFDIDEADLNKGGKIVDFPKGIVVSLVKMDGTEVSPSLDLVYLPPNPKLYINTLEGSNAEITLKDVVSGETKTIEVNFFGMIGIKQ